ncbi:hypothetical protein Hdeb2414_s0006g00214171 [Helianthus debilis subsp. tardiflorus]
MAQRHPRPPLRSSRTGITQYWHLSRLEPATTRAGTHASVLNPPTSTTGLWLHWREFQYLSCKLSYMTFVSQRS